MLDLILVVAIVGLIAYIIKLRVDLHWIEDLLDDSRDEVKTLHTRLRMKGPTHAPKKRLPLSDTDQKLAVDEALRIFSEARKGKHLE